MSAELLDSLCSWADVQSLLNRSNVSEVSFKWPLARRMLAVAVELYKWHKHRVSAVRWLDLTTPQALQGAVAEQGMCSLSRLVGFPTNGFPTSTDADESERAREQDRVSSCLLPFFRSLTLHAFLVEESQDPVASQLTRTDHAVGEGSEEGDDIVAGTDAGGEEGSDLDMPVEAETESEFVHEAEVEGLLDDSENEDADTMHG